MTRRPRVLFVDSTSSFGGATTSLSHLVRGLARAGVDSVVVSGLPTEELRHLFPDTPVHHNRFNRRWVAWTGPPPSLPRKLAIVGGRLIGQDLPSALFVLRIAVEHDVDLIHFNNGTAQTDACIAGLITGLPMAAHHRGIVPSDASRTQRIMSRIVRHHFAISEPVRRGVETLDVSESRISVVHDGIDLEQFDPDRLDVSGLREELGLPSHADVVGFFGRLVPWKGPDRFIQALALIADDPTVYGLIVGNADEAGEDYFRQLRGLVAEEGLQERVVFAGFRRDVPRLMKICDVVVHASVEPEPFGMVVAEAMVVGTAVVAADQGGPLEIVRPGIDGFLVDADRPEEIARKVKVLLDDPELRLRLAASGRVRAREMFSADRYARGVMKGYTRLGLELGDRLA